MRYRRKPVEVQAIRWDGTPEAAGLIALIAAEGFQVLDAPWNDDPDATAICRSSLVGWKWVPVYPGDYIILDHEAHVFPLHGVLFHDQYEAIVPS